MGKEQEFSLTALEGVISSLVIRSGELKQSVIELAETLERSYIYNQLVSVFKHYNLGEVIEAHEIFGGYVNRSFGVYTINNGRKNRYFVRLYKPGITESEIELEHSLIDFSIANGLEMAAGLIRTTNQKTFVKIREEFEDKAVNRFWAVYDFLPGEDKYTWDNPDLNDEEFASAAEVLATLHNAARNFDPRGRKRIEPKILELLPMLPGLFKEFADQEGNSKFHKYLAKTLPEIIEVSERVQIPDDVLSELVLNPIHSDFHPGNLKFKDNKVVGIFDFDWCKIDLRIFDISLALAYSCSSWQDEQDGHLRLDKCKIFLESYQKKLESLGGLPPLNEVELQYLPTMIAAANIYLINWCVTSYYTGTDLNVYEYLAYLQHHIRLMRRIEDNKEEISLMTESIKVIDN